jgi:hypothetical protein
MLMLPVQEAAPLVSVNGPPIVVPPLFTASTVTESTAASVIRLFAPKPFSESGEQDITTSTAFEPDDAPLKLRLQAQKRQREVARKIVPMSFFICFPSLILCSC